jgi:hypothetical protein
MTFLDLHASSNLTLGGHLRVAAAVNIQSRGPFHSFVPAASHRPPRPPPIEGIASDNERSTTTNRSLSLHLCPMILVCDLPALTSALLGDFG